MTTILSLATVLRQIDEQLGVAGHPDYHPHVNRENEQRAWEAGKVAGAREALAELRWQLEALSAQATAWKAA